VDNSPDPPHKPQKPHCDDDAEGAKPPGQFVTDELEAETARFIKEVKGLARRRKEGAAGEKRGPPPPENDQRSSRR
jgi:hypothetical protein